MKIKTLAELTDLLDQRNKITETLNYYGNRELLLDRCINAVKLVYLSDNKYSNYYIHYNKNFYGNWYEWFLDACPNNYNKDIFIESNGDINLYGKKNNCVLLTVKLAFLKLSREKVIELLNKAHEEKEAADKYEAKWKEDVDKRKYEELKARFEKTNG